MDPIQCLTISQIAAKLDCLSVLDLTIGCKTVPEFETALKTDFGSIDDAKNMFSSSLLIWLDGISGFMDMIINELLNSLPLDHPTYGALMTLLGMFCRELVKKKTNHKKVGSPFVSMFLTLSHLPISRAMERGRLDLSLIEV